VICYSKVSDLESACYIKIAIFWDLTRAVWETGTKVSGEHPNLVFSVEGGIAFFEDFYLSTNSTVRDSNIRSIERLSSTYWVRIEYVLGTYRESERLKFNFMTFSFTVYDRGVFKHVEGFFEFLWRNSCVCASFSACVCARACVCMLLGKEKDVWGEQTPDRGFYKIKKIYSKFRILILSAISQRTWRQDSSVIRLIKMVP
jgi:hypothetical protein